MRLVYTSTDPHEAKTIAGILKSDSIESQLEVKTENDWGSPQYGDFDINRLGHRRRAF